MSDITPLFKRDEVTQESVAKVLAHWVPRMRLGDWTINAVIHVTNDKWPAERTDELAFVTVYPGQRADVDISKVNYDEQTDETLDKVLVHELGHVINWKYRTLLLALFGPQLEELALQIDEEICEQWAKALTNEPLDPKVNVQIAEELE